MAILCRKCHADVTEAFHSAELKQKFVCAECQSTEFRYQVDDPKVPYTLNANDRRFLRGARIGWKEERE